MKRRKDTKSYLGRLLAILVVVGVTVAIYFMFTEDEIEPIPAGNSDQQQIEMTASLEQQLSEVETELAKFESGQLSPDDRYDALKTLKVDLVTELDRVDNHDDLSQIETQLNELEVKYDSLMQ